MGDSTPRATATDGEAAEGTRMRIAFVPALTGLVLNVAEDQGYLASPQT